MQKERKLSKVAKSLLTKLILPVALMTAGSGCYTVFENPVLTKSEQDSTYTQNKNYLDSDGDGIENFYDPYPYLYGLYTDLNGNGIIDEWDAYIGLGMNNCCTYPLWINSWDWRYPYLGFMSYLNYTMYYGGYFSRIYYPNPIDVRGHEKAKETPARPRGEIQNIGQRDGINITRVRVPESVKTNNPKVRAIYIPPQVNSPPQPRVRYNSLPNAGENPQIRVRAISPPETRSNPPAPRPSAPPQKNRVRH